MDYEFMKIAEETQYITKNGYYELNGEKIELKQTDSQPFTEVKVFSPEALEKLYLAQLALVLRKPLEKYGKIYVVEQDSFAAAKNMEKPLVLNFASGTHKGGGFLSGSHAQEESLCRCSTLYASLTAPEAQEYYDHNRSLRSPLYSDYMLISPNVCVFRDTQLNLLQDVYNVAVATVPAPNLRTFVIDKNDLTQLMLTRIRKFLSLAAHEGYKNLVLGAWGCGAFRHNPTDVAGYFYKVLLDEGFAALFDTITFAIIKSETNLQAFRAVFGDCGLRLENVRKQENREILSHLRSIESIIESKCARCNTVYGCLGCNWNEIQQDIEHARSIVG